MNKKEFDQFFESYAKSVDLTAKIPFWKLNDALILNTIKKYIPSNLEKSQCILDAGGGTGRWICLLSDIYQTDFILFDYSEDMLVVAKNNILAKGIKERVEIVQGDLTDMSAIPSESVDYIVSIYNPISFVDQKDLVAKEFYRILKKGGVALVMGQGYCNALYSQINNYHASNQNLEKLNELYIVKWNEYVPELYVFSKETLEALFENAGFKIESSYGIPVFTQPGKEDFDPENQKISAISEYLSNQGVFDMALKIELAHYGEPSVVNRGMNIFTVIKK